MKNCNNCRHFTQEPDMNATVSWCRRFKEPLNLNGWVHDPHTRFYPSDGSKCGALRGWEKIISVEDIGKLEAERDHLKARAEALSNKAKKYGICAFCINFPLRKDEKILCICMCSGDIESYWKLDEACFAESGDGE